jgi:hypothetical protein
LDRFFFRLLLDDLVSPTWRCALYVAASMIYDFATLPDAAEENIYFYSIRGSIASLLYYATESLIMV